MPLSVASEIKAALKRYLCKKNDNISPTETKPLNGVGDENANVNVLLNGIIYREDKIPVPQKKKKKKSDNEKTKSKKEDKMGRLCRKLGANLWKCGILHKRHYILTAVVVLLPITLFILLAYLRSEIAAISKIHVTEPAYNDVLWEDQIYERYKFNIEDTQLLYAPKTRFTDDLMRKVQLQLGVLNNGIKAFTTEEALMLYFKSVTPNITYAVVFKGLTGEEIPQNLKYEIRNYEALVDWQTNELYHPLTGMYMPGLASEKYFQKGFISLQMAIDTFFIRMRDVDKKVNVTITMQEFPYPPYVADLGTTEMFAHMLPFVTMFSFMFLIPAILKRLVEEKASGIKELMKMMGLPTSIMWFCWFLDALLLNTIAVVFITIIMKATWSSGAQPIEYCDGFIFFLFLLLYCAACISLCFFISTLFNSPNMTVIFAISVWMITYIIPYCLHEEMGRLGCIEKFARLLLPNFAMYYGYRNIEAFEIRGIGVQWNNLRTAPSGREHEVTMSCVFVMLLVDIIMYFALAFYIDSIRPGKFGVGRKWYFPLESLAKLIKRKLKRQENVVSFLPNHQSEYIKIESCSLLSGIQIEDLSKTYGNKVALNNLTINFYKGEITALLGHNGAGKTTTMSILTGMVRAKQGSVVIGDYNLEEHIDQIRTMIGICPQHNMLFPDLTVWEHLKFFAMLNDVPKANSKIAALLQRLNLITKTQKVPSELSGGMKRKLCLGMAMISDPEVLILDEPTSGLDPKSRREIWDILLEWRNTNLGKRTILISTHFMEEADVLGDRIAVLDHGNLVAYGTPMFLRNEYCTGHKLTIVKKDNKESDKKLEDLIDAEILQSSLKLKAQNIRVFLLPNDEKQKFSSLLKKLEMNKDDLEIENITISITTLEDVFLKISNLIEDDDKDIKNASKLNSPSSVDITIHDGFTRSEGRNFMILFRNHFLTFKKTSLKYLFNVLIALLCIIYTVCITSPNALSHLGMDRPAFSMNLNKYGNTFVYYGTNKHAENNDINELLKNYNKTVSEENANLIFSPSVSDGLIEMGTENIAKYKMRAVVAAEFNYTKEEGILANAMYSNLALHGSPIALNLITNTIAKTLLGEETTIEMKNFPLPQSDTESTRKQSEILVGLAWAFIVPFGMIFLTGCCIIIPLRERVSNLKQLIYMTGVSSFSYWFQMLLYDLCLYIGVIIVFIFAMMICQNPIFLGINELWALAVIFIVYGLTSLPYNYLFSYKNTITGAYVLLIMLCLLTGVVLTIIVYIMKVSGEEYYENLGYYLHIIFHVNPQYWITYNMFIFTMKAVENYNWDQMQGNQKTVKCKFSENPCCYGTEQECSDFKSYFQNGLSVEYIFLYLLPILIVYFVVLLILDSTLFKKLKECTLKWIVFDPKETEAATVFSAEHLTKKFGNKEVVKDLSFNVNKGTCFGLLGVNGAGKTTTFRMLTGDCIPNKGTAVISKEHDDFTLHKTRNKYLSQIGYCPQFDAINEVLTGRELLTFFAELRGMTSGINEAVGFMIENLGLQQYADAPCGKYSGGNKRKLCLGIALIVNPSVILLDEPTSGVDPVSRRKLWNIMKQIKNAKKQAIILTSHSMDECEALCDSLAIMKEGVVKCQDNVPNLKVDYGTGFTVLVKIKKEPSYDTVDSSTDLLLEVDNVEDKFFEHFQSQHPVLKDKHLSLLHFYVPNTITLSDIFQEMEAFKTKYIATVEDYMIAMASLEDVFLSFSENEGAEQEVKSGFLCWNRGE